jgi:hypothetical protein
MPKFTMPYSLGDIERKAIETRSLEKRIIENIGGGKRKT